MTAGRSEGCRVLVTGGSRGIGRAVCEAFAREGARVAVHSSGKRGPVDLRALPGGPHLAVQGDLADPDAVHAFVREAARGLDGLDVLVNNAGLDDRLTRAGRPTRGGRSTGAGRWTSTCWGRPGRATARCRSW